MPKRKRTSSVELIAIMDDGIIIEYNQREYFVNQGDVYVKHFENSDLEVDVVHNYENRAMLNIENIRSGEILLRQEINPFKYKDSDEWVQDE